jgi:hypothetical protein
MITLDSPTLENGDASRPFLLLPNAAHAVGIPPKHPPGPSHQVTVAARSRTKKDP